MQVQEAAAPPPQALIIDSEMEDNLDDLIIHNLGGPRILYTENSKEVVSVREDIEYVSSHGTWSGGQREEVVSVSHYR